MEKIKIDDEVFLIPYYPYYRRTLLWYQDLEVCKQTDNVEKAYQLSDLKGMYRFLSTHGECYYIKYKNKLVGDITLKTDGEICIVIAKEYHNLHIGTRAVKGILKRAKDLKYLKCTAHIYSFNHQSQAMFGKIGFKYTGNEQYEYLLDSNQNFL